MFENTILPKELKPTDPRFGVGPSLIPQSVLQSLALTGHHLMGHSHRKPIIIELVKEIQDGLKKYFSLPSGYEVILGNGGATLFWDMIGLGLVEQSSFHFVNGEFSEKWLKAHQLIPWIKTDHKTVQPGLGLTPYEVESFDLIACTQNETSTGVQLSTFPKMSKALLAVDATSSAGQVPIPFENVDIYYFSPQKVFASDGGLYVAILSPRAIERAMKISQNKMRYIPEGLNLKNAIENGKIHQTYNTPAIATLYFLNEQIKKLNQIGFKKVIEESEKKSSFIYSWVEEKKYLEAFVKEKEFRSKTVATIDLDEKYKATDLAQVLRKNDFAYDIEGYRKLGRNQLRVGLFHNISIENLKLLTEVISFLIEKA